MTEAVRVSTWRIVLAAILDFFTAFFVLGFIVGLIFGGANSTGFQLEGASALLLLALIVAYFVIFNRYLGGTIWKRILRAVR